MKFYLYDILERPKKKKKWQKTSIVARNLGFRGGTDTKNTRKLWGDENATHLDYGVIMQVYTPYQNPSELYTLKAKFYCM